MPVIIPEIIRFNNPVHFVPNGQYLLIIPTEIPAVMSERRFEVYEKDAETNHAPITTPEIVAVGQQISEKVSSIWKNSWTCLWMTSIIKRIFCREGGKYKSPINQLFNSERTGRVYSNDDEGGGGTMAEKVKYIAVTVGPIGETFSLVSKPTGLLGSQLSLFIYHPEQLTEKIQQYKEFGDSDTVL